MSQKTDFTARRILVLVALLGIAGIVGWWWRNRAPVAPGGNTSSGSAAVVPGGSVTLLTSGSAQSLFQKLADAFAAEQPGASVIIQTKESRDGLQYLLQQTGDSDRPDLYSPSDPRLATSLEENWKKSHGGRSLINVSSAEEDIIFAETPVILLTTAAKEAELRPLLTGAQPWEAVRQSIASGKEMSWGKLHFSFASPIRSATGLIALGMIQDDSIRTKKTLDSFLKELSSGIIYDDPAKNGSSQLFESYISELTSQGNSPRDFIVAYESNALQATLDHPELSLRVLYPVQVPFSMHRICVLSGSRSSPERRKIALAFLRFLKGKTAQRLVIESRLHPRFSLDTLSQQINTLSESGFMRVRTRAAMPRYNDVMNAAQLWNERIAPGLAQ